MDQAEVDAVIATIKQTRGKPQWRPKASGLWQELRLPLERAGVLMAELVLNVNQISGSYSAIILMRRHPVLRWDFRAAPHTNQHGCASGKVVVPTPHEHYWAGPLRDRCASPLVGVGSGLDGDVVAFAQRASIDLTRPIPSLPPLQLALDIP